MKKTLLIAALLAVSPAAAGTDGSGNLYCGPKQVYVTRQAGPDGIAPFSELRKEVIASVEGDEKVGAKVNLADVDFVVKSNLKDLMRERRIKSYTYTVIKDKTGFFVPINADGHAVTVNYGRPPCGVRKVF